MKESFENKDSATLLVCELQPGDQLEGVSLRALVHNKLQGFAAASFSQVGDTKYIRYNISGKTPVSRLMGGAMRKKSMLGMLSGIVNAMLSAEANQVAAQTVMLDLNHVFTDPATGETVLICMPLVSAQPTKITVAMLCRNLLTNIRLENGEDGGFVSPLLNYLNGNPNPALAELKDALDRAASSAPQQPAAPVQPPVRPQPVTQQPQPQTDKPMSMFYLLQNYNKENAAAYKTQKTPKQPAAQQHDFAVPGVPQKPAAPVQPLQPPVQNRPVQPVQPYYPPQPAAPQNGAYGYPQQPVAPQPPVTPAPKPPVVPVPQPEPDYGATTVLDDPGATTVLDAGMLSSPKAYLVRKKNGEKIPLTKDFFRIGKEKTFVDYFVSDNTAVSRAHAYIITKNGEYFIVDTNSTNHTYINGGMIPPNVETRLSHGAKLRLANEDFEFLLH